MLSIGIKYQSYTVIHLYLAQILEFWVTCGVKTMSLCQGLVDADKHLKLLTTSILDIVQSV
jgi:hypothetical protein